MDRRRVLHRLGVQIDIGKAAERAVVADRPLAPELAEDRDPSTTRAGRSSDLTPITSSSCANCGPSNASRHCRRRGSSAPPTARRGSPIAARNSSGSRNGKLARQTVPSFTRLVRTAIADSATTASTRGFDNRLSPTQTPWNRPESSAVSAMSSRSPRVPQSNRIARVESDSPNFSPHFPPGSWPASEPVRPCQPPSQESTVRATTRATRSRQESATRSASSTPWPPPTPYIAAGTPAAHGPPASNVPCP